MCTYTYAPLSVSIVHNIHTRIEPPIVRCCSDVHIPSVASINEVLQQWLVKWIGPHKVNGRHTSKVWYCYCHSGRVRIPLRWRVLHPEYKCSVTPYCKALAGLFLDVKELDVTI